jgi:hypothetical protein
MNEQLIQELKQRMPDFDDPKKLSNLEIRATKHHEREGRYSKMVFNNFSQALAEIETKLKGKHKIARDLCRATAGRFVIAFELPAAESKKKLEKSLQAARNEYDNWVSNQQEEWLNLQLESALQEQAAINTKNQEKEDADFKATLLKALQAY